MGEIDEDGYSESFKSDGEAYNLVYYFLCDRNLESALITGFRRISTCANLRRSKNWRCSTTTTHQLAD
jgi:hypothetical protein